MRKEVFFVILLAAFIVFSTRLPIITGNAALKVEADANSPDLLQGDIKYDFSNNRVLPLDTEVILSINNYYSRKTLSELLPQDFIDKYAKEVDFAPAVSVVLERNSSTSSINGFFSLIDRVTVSVNPGSGGSSGGSFSGNSQNSSGSSPAENSGSASNDETYVVKYGDDKQLLSSHYTVKSARLLRGPAIDPSLVYFSSGKLGTNYFEKVRGFSSETPDLRINMSAFGYSLGQKANIKAIFYYKGETLDESEQTLFFTSKGPLLSPIFENDREQQLNLLQQGCVIQRCGDYSECSPSFPPDSLEVDKDSLFKMRTCTYIDCGKTYPEWAACAIESKEIDILPRKSNDVLTSPSINPDIENWSTIGFHDLSSGNTKIELGFGQRLQLKIHGSLHYVGITDLSDNGAAVLFDDQNSFLEMQENTEFDFDGNKNDIKVTLLSISNNKALLSVEPSNSEIPFGSLSNGDRALTLIDDENNEPIAHVKLNDQQNIFDVILVQSYDDYPQQCSNAVRDAGENEIDCGGLCEACKQEGFHYYGLMASAAATLFGIILLLVFRKRFSSEL